MNILFRHRRRMAWCLLIVMSWHCFTPSVTYALTSGPSQPEVQSFEPVGTTEMVDLFTGDFTYNIPLFELPGPNGGYPFNLAYHAGVGLDQEASWCGLGWNLNPGAITRQMRGLPDEFKGDVVTTTNASEPSVTAGVGVGAGVEVFGGALNIGMGLSVSSNNYRGVGYSVDGSLGISKAFGSGMTAGVGLNIGLDNQQGSSLSPSISLSQVASSEEGTQRGSISVGSGYSSREGLRQLTLSGSQSKPYQDKKGRNRSASLGQVSSPISLASPGYTPQISQPMRNVNLSATIKVGGAWWGVFGAPYLRGFYHEQWLANNGKPVDNAAYGYLHYQDAPVEERVMLDVNREKDGPVSKTSPNLASPSLTYDIYSVTGQGISAMYRPLRTDVGTVHNPLVSSSSAGGDFGADVAPALSHVGVNGSANFGDSYSGPWREHADVATALQFQDFSLNSASEPWYFKVHGEPSAQPSGQYDALGKDLPVQVSLSDDRNNPVAQAELRGEDFTQDATNAQLTNQERAPRSQVITPVTNQQLLANDTEVQPAFRITYLDNSGNSQALNRSAFPENHLAGLTALTPEGLRYHYALPAYNHTQEDVQFSVDGSTANGTRVPVSGSGEVPDYQAGPSSDYLSRTELPAYVHAHLLTSIVGPDYVDLTGDGVSADDLGYWVKFTYQRATNDYQWRSPYQGAIYQEGFKTDQRDDQGSFSYGTKDVWYLAQAETKSHVARFVTSARSDGRGVSNKLQGGGSASGQALRKLDEVKLYTRSAGESTPLLKVKLDYKETLCPGIPNSSSSAGKLTLKQLWFEYGSSTRGSITPYQFNYHGEGNASYSYNEDSYDRWGQFRPAPAGDPLFNQESPYVNQDPADKATLDAQASAWSLKTIALPSGGLLTVDYETDDYAYVQHRPALQMTPLAKPSGGEGNTLSLSHDDRKVYFKLEQPVAGTLSASEQRAEVMRYLEADRPLVYFKLLMNLLRPGAQRNEYVTGYAKVDLSADMGLVASGGNYTTGYFTLAPVESDPQYHPFRLRAWQHLRTNQPDLINPTSPVNQADSEAHRIQLIKGLAGAFGSITELFRGFYGTCDKREWAKEVVLGKSWVRLASPDKVKYGGGLRVRQITMQDQWEHNKEGVYGQVYQYTTEEDGALISSGVAANEPMLGGDETALRYPKPYTESVPLRSDNNLFFEYPINESYYPGAGVGYSEVTVKSLAAAALAGELPRDVQLIDGKSVFPSGDVAYGTSGQSVHEFYTARDFPVIARETDKQDRPYQLQIPIPFLGHVSVNKLTSSQGYSILTNDMHGQPRRVSHYRQTSDGSFDPSPLSWVAYHYASEDAFYDGQAAATLTNGMVDNDDGTVSLADDQGTAPLHQGQEHEFFVDMREHTDKTWTGGANINTDVMIIPLPFIPPFPVPSVWPMASKSTQQLKTVVTNKVIFRRGILQRTEAYNEGSLITTENLRWDKLTGQPVLTTVNNNFDEPIFSYNQPAYHAYAGMGGAYRNAGLTLSVHDVAPTEQEGVYTFSPHQDLDEDLLVPGDEWTLYALVPLATASAIYLGRDGDTYRLHCDTELTGTLPYVARVERSGYRNQLSTLGSSIQALQNPTELSDDKLSYQRKVTVPLLNTQNTQ